MDINGKLFLFCILNLLLNLLLFIIHNPLILNNILPIYPILASNGINLALLLGGSKIQCLSLLNTGYTPLF